MNNLETITNTSADGVYIFGAGGHAKVVAGLLFACGHKIAAFIDDNAPKSGKQFLDYQLLHPDDLQPNTEVVQAVIAIGDNKVRKNKAEIWTGHFAWNTYVHSTVWKDQSASVGHGTVVFAGSIIQADVVIGNHVIINTGAMIDHDCHIGDYSHIAPGVCMAGNVMVGSGTIVGIGVSVIPGVNIGQNCIIGAGAVVIYDIPDNSVAVGVPARIIRTNR